MRPSCAALFAVVLFLSSLGSGLGLPSAATASSSTVQYFLSARAYSNQTENIPAAIRADYGSNARMADWNEIKTTYGGSVQSIQQFMNDLGLTYDSYKWVTRGGSEYYNSSRHYLVARHDGHEPTYNFLHHDQILNSQNCQLGLGSWYGTCKAIVRLDTNAPAFEIVSANLDRSSFQEGSTAHLTVTIKSNWRSSSNLTLVPMMVPAQGDEIQLPADAFSLGAGGQHTSNFSWAVPDLNYCTWWDVRLELRDSGNLVLNETENVDVATSDVDPAMTEQVQAQMVACERGAACGSALVSAVPYLGLLNDQYAAKSLHCVTDAYELAGDHLNASLFRWYESAADFLSILDKASTVASLLSLNPIPELIMALPQVALGGLICAGEYVYSAEYGDPPAAVGTYPWTAAPASPARVPGAYVAALGDSVLGSIDSTWMSCADVVLVEGRNRARVMVGSCFTTKDTIGVAGALVWNLGPNHEASWTQLASNPHCFGTDGQNPRAVGRVEVRPDSTDTLAVVLLHRGQDGQLRKHTYPVLAVGAAAVLQLHLADSLMVIPLEYDHDGDGVVDALIYSDEVTAVPGGPASRPEGPPLRATVAPNPARGSVRFVLEASRPLSEVIVEVYDVSGRRVRKLTVGKMIVGSRMFDWDGRGNSGAPLRSGVYFYRAGSDQGSGGAKRMLLLR